MSRVGEFYADHNVGVKRTLRTAGFIGVTGLAACGSSASARPNASPSADKSPSAAASENRLTGKDIGKKTRSLGDMCVDVNDPHSIQRDGSTTRVEFKTKIGGHVLEAVCDRAVSETDGKPVVSVNAHTSELGDTFYQIAASVDGEGVPTWHVLDNGVDKTSRAKIHEHGVPNGSDAAQTYRQTASNISNILVHAVGN